MYHVLHPYLEPTLIPLAEDAGGIHAPPATSSSLRRPSPAAEKIVLPTDRLRRNPIQDGTISTGRRDIRRETIREVEFETVEDKRKRTVTHGLERAREVLETLKVRRKPPRARSEAVGITTVDRSCPTFAAPK